MIFKSSIIHTHNRPRHHTRCPPLSSPPTTGPLHGRLYDMDWVKFPVLPLVERQLIANCILVFLTLITAALRIWSRILSGAKLWWDDYLVLFALPQGIGMLVIQGMCKCHDRNLYSWTTSMLIQHQGQRWARATLRPTPYRT